MELLDGKKTSLEIQTELSEKVKLMVGNGINPPHLVAVLVGDDGNSYIRISSRNYITISWVIIWICRNQ